MPFDIERNFNEILSGSDTTLGVTKLTNGSQNSLGANTVATVATYTAPAGGKKVSRISCSGTDYAKWTLVLNTSTIEVKRSGPDRSVEFEFANPLELAVTDILDVKVEHYVTGETGNFETTIYGA